MKRIIVFWLVLLLPVIVFSQEYKSSEIKIKFSVDNEYTVLTRDNLDDTVLESLNTSKEKMKSLMENNNIYYDIVKSDLSYEILIVVPNVTPSYPNLLEATDEELTALKNTIIKETGDTMPIIYKNKYAFVVVNYQDSNGYVKNYYTVVNSRGYNIQLQKKTEITDEEEDELKEIIDSIEFETPAKKQEEKKSIDIKVILWSILIGLVAGVITYLISTSITKKNSDKKKNEEKK